MIRWFLYKLFNKAKPGKFKPGDVVTWEPNPIVLQSLTEKQRKQYYSVFGYGAEKKKLFIYICDINDCGVYPGVRMNSGHCVLLDMDDGHLEYMRHPDDFRYATDEEF